MKGSSFLAAAAEPGRPVKLRVLPDGVDGFTQEVLLTSLKDDASPDDYQKVSYEATAIGDKQAYAGP
jgi:hypothetical protein